MVGPNGLKAQWFHILLSIADRPLHGAAIVEEVLDRTQGDVRLWPGMLYKCLKDLAEAGLATEVSPPPEAPTEGGKRRFYLITGPGRLALSREVERMASYVELAQQKQVGGGSGPA